MTQATDCPCGSGKALSACCEPYISGKAKAPTAEALMRARYTSYATGRVDFVEKTLAPESRHTRLYAKYQQRLDEIRAGQAPLGIETIAPTLASPVPASPAAPATTSPSGSAPAPPATQPVDNRR